MNHHLLAGIPEEALRLTPLPNDKGHNAVWDFARSPDNRYYVTVCGENELPLSALLYEYDPKDGSLRLIFDVEKAWISDPAMMPHSKIHTSIDFLPDGNLIMATHNTSPAARHPRWLYEQHYEDLWEGFPGSLILIVNPDTGAVQAKGIPVARESIYGGVLGKDGCSYYFLGYMRGHFYRLDLRTNEVKDYGKISEYSSFRLVKDAKDRIYGGTISGELWRYDPATDEIEDLKAVFDSPHGTKYRRQLVHGLLSPAGTLFFASNVDADLIELDPETLTVTRHGYMHLRPEQPRNPKYVQAIGGLAADEDFVLYYGLETYHDAELVRLVRWDVLGGGAPENLGLVSPSGKQSQYLCEMIFDVDGYLHMVDVCGPHSPYIVRVDVKALKAPDETTPVARIAPVEMPNMHMNDDRVFYSHIEAGTISAFPLHRHARWKDSAVIHAQAAGSSVYAVTGTERLCVLEIDFACKEPIAFTILDRYAPAVSAHPLGDDHAAVLTADGKWLIVDLPRRHVVRESAFHTAKPLRRIFAVNPDGAILSDGSGDLYHYRFEQDALAKLGNAALPDPEAVMIPVNEHSFLVSGYGDEVVRYNWRDRTKTVLPFRVPSVKGRAFRACITGGCVLDDGSIVCGTADGMLFTIDRELASVRSYGRLFSSGALRAFRKAGPDAVLGIYGSARDAGHVFYFSADRGFVDIGKPRVIKDHTQLQACDSEWANIHEISCLLYVPERDELYVCSGERFGSIIRYRNLVI